MSCSIAPVTPQDREAVVDLLIAQMHEHRVESERDRLQKVVAAVMADERYGFILAAREAERVVGIAYVASILSVEHGGRAGWLEELFVVPELRGKGIGAALLQASMARSRQVGFIALDLEVDAEHQRAESLYRRFGFHGLPRSRWQVAMSTARQ